MADEPRIEHNLAHIKTRITAALTEMPALLEYLAGYFRMVQASIEWAEMELQVKDALIQAREKEIMLVRTRGVEEAQYLLRRLAGYRVALDRGLKIIPATFPCGGTEGFVRPGSSEEILGCLCHTNLDLL